MTITHDDGSVEFRFYRPGAQSVTLAGDFNGWQHACFPMKRCSDGWWSYRFQLGAGTYQFKYCADGEWYLDYAAFGLERSPYGWNSVVCIEPPKHAIQAA
ncbi:MAG: glycogen-binding domain-containing protein [Phycisphaerae bacterium]|nr:glycogen-binding domain-containing protein [Phycisphaerae bacterium]